MYEVQGSVLVRTYRAAMRRFPPAHGQANVETWGTVSRGLLWQNLFAAMHRTVH